MRLILCISITLIAVFTIGVATGQRSAVVESGNHHTNLFQTKAVKHLPKVKWKFQTTGNSYGPPLIYNGVAYFGDEGGFMHAVNVKDGSEK